MADADAAGRTHAHRVGLAAGARDTAGRYDSIMRRGAGLRSQRVIREVVFYPARLIFHHSERPMEALVESMDEEDLRGPPPAKEAFSPIDRRVSAPSTPAFSPGASFESPKMPTPSAKQALLARLNDVSIPSSPWGAATTPPHSPAVLTPTRHFESTAASPGWGRTGGGFRKVGTEDSNSGKDGTLRLKETMSPNATVKVYSPVRQNPIVTLMHDVEAMEKKQGEIARRRRDRKETKRRTTLGEFEEEIEMPDGPPLEPEGSYVPRLRPTSSPSIVRVRGSIRKAEATPRVIDGRTPTKASTESALRTARVVPGMHPVGTGASFLEWSTRVPGKPTPPKPRNPPVPKTKDLMRRRKPKKVLKKSQKMAVARWKLAREWVLEKVRADKRRQIRRNLDAVRQRREDERAAEEAARAAAIRAEEDELDDELMRLEMATDAFQQLWLATAA